MPLRRTELKLRLCYTEESTLPPDHRVQRVINPWEITHCISGTPLSTTYRKRAHYDGSNQGDSILHLGWEAVQSSWKNTFMNKMMFLGGGGRTNTINCIRGIPRKYT